MSAPHRPEFDAMADRIRDVLAGRPAVFFINPGNWGDSVIREGAESFLRYYDIDYLPVRFKHLVKNRIKLSDVIAATGHAAPAMIYNGCGAFSPHYALLPKVAELSRNFETAIFLPSTFALDVDRSLFCDDAHFFVRDRLQSQERMPDAPFCHDMAFFLEPVADAATQKTGLFFREDMEAPEGFEVPKGNVDLSKLGRAHTPIDRLLDRIGAYEQVHTNRLHIGIAATLLGRQTHIYANDYFKIAAIFESSIKDYFPNSSFATQFEGA